MPRTTRVAIHTPTEPNFGAAMERVVEATREVVETRVQLVQMELRSKAKQSGRMAALLAGGLFLFVVAWLAISAAGAMALSRVVAADVATAIVAGVNAILALACLAAASAAAPGSEGDA